ncbi:MAG: DUF2029 domain-containing protein [Euzebyaceae bacterium]|nr:DUF2029 domain-containing protein [Euzebyaceae bacterium]
MVVSPSLLVLGAQNWNLWTLAPVAAGLAAAARGRTARAGAWFGLAAGIKWWPALLVIPLIVGRWADQPAGPAGLRRRRRTAPAVAAAGTWALVQLPALAVSPANQWRSISFHLGREPNRGGHVAAALGLLRQAGVELSSDPGPVLDAVSLAVLVLGAAVVVRRLSRRLVDPVDAMLALVALFLVTSKIFSRSVRPVAPPAVGPSRVPARRLVLVHRGLRGVAALRPVGGAGRPVPALGACGGPGQGRLVAWVLQRHDAARRRSSRGSPGAAATLGRPPVPVNRPALS